MSKYRCGACKFRFETNKMPKKCPYCSREASIMLEETAEELIRDVDKLLD